MFIYLNLDIKKPLLQCYKSRLYFVSDILSLEQYNPTESVQA